jgi:hypothetical protein
VVEVYHVRACYHNVWTRLRSFMRTYDHVRNGKAIVSKGFLYMRD